MYGSIARYRLQPGMEEQLLDLQRKIQGRRCPGWLADSPIAWTTTPTSTIKRLSSRAGRPTALVESPEQVARYRELLAILTGPPEWHDGIVVSAGALGPANDAFEHETSATRRRAFAAVPIAPRDLIGDARCCPALHRVVVSLGPRVNGRAERGGGDANATLRTIFPHPEGMARRPHMLAAARGDARPCCAPHGTPKISGNHVEHACAKIGVSNRARASRFAIQHGLITDTRAAAD
jgi:hypothetical protein